MRMFFKQSVNLLHQSCFTKFVDQSILQKMTNFYNKVHDVKSVQTWSFFWSVFFLCELNMEIYFLV